MQRKIYQVAAASPVVAARRAQARCRPCRRCWESLGATSRGPDAMPKGERQGEKWQSWRVYFVTFWELLPDAFPAEHVQLFFQLRKYEIPLVMKEQKGLTPMILAGENINN